MNTLSQYMVKPRHAHLVATKHVMRYLKGTLDYGLIYASCSEIKLHGYVDLAWVGSVEDKKRTSWYCFSLGSGVISWLGRKKTNFVLNAADDEYIAAFSASSEAMCICNLLEWLFDAKIDAIDIYCDNQSCIKMTENSVFHDKSKHIEIKYRYIWDMVRRKVVKLQYVPTKEQVVD